MEYRVGLTQANYSSRLIKVILNVLGSCMMQTVANFPRIYVPPVNIVSRDYESRIVW